MGRSLLWFLVSMLFLYRSYNIIRKNVVNLLLNVLFKNMIFLFYVIYIFFYCIFIELLEDKIDKFFFSICSMYINGILFY